MSLIAPNGFLFLLARVRCAHTAVTFRPFTCPPRCGRRRRRRRSPSPSPYPRSGRPWPASDIHCDCFQPSASGRQTENGPNHTQGHRCHSDHQPASLSHRPRTHDITRVLHQLHRFDTALLALCLPLLQNNITTHIACIKTRLVLYTKLGRLWTGIYQVLERCIGHESNRQAD